MREAVSSALIKFLVNNAERVSPPKFSVWAAAMKNEMPATNPEERLSWALGCWKAAFSQMLRSPDLSPLNLLIVLLLLTLMAADLFASLLTLAYRLNFLNLAGRLGSFTPGDDFHRLIPLMEGLPLWLHGLMLLAGACYVLAIGFTLFRVRWGFVCVLSALGLEAVAQLLSKPIIDAIGVAADPHPTLAARLLPILLPLALAATMWNRSSKGTQTASF